MQINFQTRNKARDFKAARQALGHDSKIVDAGPKAGSRWQVVIKPKTK